MAERNHSYIDVLKMDIEGAEWAFVENEAEMLKNVGQLLIEVHFNCDSSKFLHSRFPTTSFHRLLVTLESHGLRLFYKEINPFYPDSCAEFSLIQRYWGQWDASKKHT